jgi:uncharacterized membrane protein YjjP (DUF1212 family)
MTFGQLPPLRHPSWLIVLTIALFGGSLTALMGGSSVLSTMLVSAGAFAGVVTARVIRRLPGQQSGS